MTRWAPFQAGVGRPLHRGQVIGPELGFLALHEVELETVHGQVVVTRQRSQGVVVGAEAVHEQQRQLGSVRRPGRPHLGDDEVQERLAPPYRQQRLGPVHPHRGAEPAVELDHHRLGQGRRGLVRC